jgi:hypothetical protein
LEEVVKLELVVLVAAQASDIAAGFIGVGIGALSGIMALLILVTFIGGLNFKGTIALLGEITAVPTFWFGGPWASGKLFKPMSDSSLDIYIMAVVVVFMVIVIWPLSRWVIRLGNRFANA